MRVLVTGGRDFDDRDLLFRVLNEQDGKRPIALLIQGGASGADRLAGEWAAANGVEVDANPADWKRYGRGAGPIRNSLMLAMNPDLVIAFPGGKGTADIVRKALDAGLTVQVSREDHT